MSKGQFFGAIAQLGERLPCTQEVGGSIPPGSTMLSSLMEAGYLTFVIYLGTFFIWFF